MEAVLQLVDRIADVVRDSLRAVILHGSLATGDFLAGRSDIDLLVVVTDLRHDRARLLERLVLEADLGDAAGIDLHVVTAAVAARPERAPPVELHVGRYAEGAVIAAADAIEAAGQVAGADRHRACDGAGVAAGRAEITHRVSADPDMAVEWRWRGPRAGRCTGHRPLR
ncbi:nucleotidyltransferase domain-containing protein [Dactylosporangium sp. NPDC005555]|uniref:nucleotidyltransferase domain-containing protein n=1 Tax=Dactylosporangium sp. NPDC005555 TaxID=3154889 RepID=UPI0033B311B0